MEDGSKHLQLTRTGSGRLIDKDGKHHSLNDTDRHSRNNSGGSGSGKESFSGKIATMVSSHAMNDLEKFVGKYTQSAYWNVFASTGLTAKSSSSPTAGLSGADYEFLWHDVKTHMAAHPGFTCHPSLLIEDFEDIGSRRGSMMNFHFVASPKLSFS